MFRDIKGNIKQTTIFSCISINYVPLGSSDNYHSALLYESLFDVVITGLNYSTIFGILMVLILCVENNVDIKTIKKVQGI